jgi:NodT family efflux transporter outer membrane factor (OMF) lipoprotein
MTVFEADFFGRLKNLSEAAFQRYLGAAEAARAARLSLIGQVAAAYLETRLSAEELDLANRTLNNWRSYLAFMENRLVAGQSQLLDLEMARSQVARAEASLAAAETVLSQAENNLALLVGSWAAKDRPDPWALAKWPRPNLPANVASTALLKRPDILEAERNLMASHADIGAARAAFFPSLSLTGELGYMSGQLDTLVASNSAGWSFVPRLTLPIFAGGRNVRNLELAWVRRSQAVAAYEKTIQVAFTEVALTLAARPKLAQEVAAQTNYLKAQRRVVELAANRYQGGAASYLDVLAAQRDFYEAEMAALRARRAEILNDIQLYLALGGGVEDDFSLNPAGGN